VELESREKRPEGLPRLPQKAANAVNASRQRPEPGVHEALIVAAHGHGEGLAQANSNQAAIQVKRVPRVLDPKGKTIQESLSYSEICKMFNKSL
jgi:hypothetical protein